MTGYRMWGSPGAVFRVPGAGSVGPREALTAMKNAGYGFAAFDPKTGDWTAERAICAQLNLPVVAWTRVRTVAELAFLATMAHSWGAAIAVNVEIGNGDGNGDTRDRVLMGAILYQLSRTGRGIVITDGWADPAGDWLGYKRWAGTVECFPEVYRPYTDVTGCLLHASAFFRAVVPMLGAFGTSWLGRKPWLSDYKVPAGMPWIVYAADDVEDWSKWH